MESKTIILVVALAVVAFLIGLAVGRTTHESFSGIYRSWSAENTSTGSTAHGKSWEDENGKMGEFHGTRGSDGKKGGCVYNEKAGVAHCGTWGY
tara:strand:- start:380 stop:661 length:282 start_codon:yes stop_codon:yes gene_type:complete